MHFSRQLLENYKLNLLIDLIPGQKCENHPIFKQNYTLELFVAFKMAYTCCSDLRGNLDFPDFIQKKFYNIN